MLIYEKHNQKVSDKIGSSLVRQAQKLEVVRYRKEVNLKPIYTTSLSKNYRYPRSVKFDKFNIGTLKVEAISRKSEEQKYALIHLHGGAYIYEYNDIYRKVALMYLHSNVNLKVFSPLYSLAPEKPYPHALNDVVLLYNYLLEQGYSSENIMIAGDSAGGGLAIAVTLFLRDHSMPLPKALITMSAWTNLGMDGESHERNKYVDPMFGEGSVPLDVKAYTTTNDIKASYISPLYGNFKEFTDMLMFVGGHEIIESDTLDLAEKAKNTNEVRVHDFAGMFHVFQLGFNIMASSRKAWRIVKEYINEKFRG